MTLAAVLFDMDGTLIDTEKVWDVALRELAARYGATLSDEARMAMLGSSSQIMMTLVSADLGLTDAERDDGAAWIDSRMADLFDGGVEWLPGARELLRSVRTAQLPTALVTNTQRSLTDLALRTIGPHHFDVVICGDEVQNTKPHADPYRTAATRLGAVPWQCVAIEDSPTGIASALAAGCVVLGIPNQVPLAEDRITVRTSLLEVDLDLLYTLAA